MYIHEFYSCDCHSSHLCFIIDIKKLYSTCIIYSILHIVNFSTHLRVFVLRPLLFPYIMGRGWVLITSECKSDQANFTAWISFLSHKIMGEISSNSETLSPNT